MRESFGGLFMLVLLLIIMFVIVAFSAVGLSIGRAFKVKNQIISYIEEYEGCRIDYEKCSGNVGELIDNYLKNVNYNNGYKVRRNSDNNNHYYEVSVIASWTLPFVNSNNTNIFSSKSSNDFSGSWSINGKTDLIKCDDKCMKNNVW